MHEHLIKWLSDIIKNSERGVPDMLAPRRGCLDYSKVYCDVRKRWFLAWNQNRHITYYIFSILIPKSVYVFFTFAPISFDDSDLIIARLSFVICRLPFWSVPRYVCWHSILIRQPFWRHYGSRISRAAGFRSFPFPGCLVLLTCLAWHGRSCRTTSKVLSSKKKKKRYL